MTNVIFLTGNRMNIDYCENRDAAQSLVDRLTRYYHDRGHIKFKAWLEPRDTANNRRFWDIRSNAIMRTPLL